jgi:acyl-CoA dehydrogenase
MIGQRLLRNAEMAAVEGPLGFGIARGNIIANGRFAGEVTALSPLHAGSRVLADLDGRVILLDTAHARARSQRKNVGGEARNTFAFDNAACTRLEGLTGERLLHLGAFLRTAQIGGALAASLEMCLRYAQERAQFGRELRKFQAIQHLLAQLAEESAAVFTASAAAARALDACDGDFAVACAKLRANMATGHAALIAHQVHGAIGITEEYDLHRFTNRLWAWRSEFGNDRFWAMQLGRGVLSQATATPWDLLTQGQTA